MSSNSGSVPYSKLWPQSHVTSDPHLKGKAFRVVAMWRWQRFILMNTYYVAHCFCAINCCLNKATNWKLMRKNYWVISTFYIWTYHHSSSVLNHTESHVSFISGARERVMKCSNETLSSGTTELQCMYIYEFIGCAPVLLKAD